MAIIYLTGRYEDGSTAAPGVALPAREVLRVERERDTTLRLFLLTSSGAPVAFDEWTSVLFSVRKHTDDAVPVLAVPCAGDSTRGAAWCSVALTPASLRNLAPGRYVYGVSGVIAGATVTLIAASAFLLAPVA